MKRGFTGTHLQENWFGPRFLGRQIGFIWIFFSKNQRVKFYKLFFSYFSNTFAKLPNYSLICGYRPTRLHSESLRSGMSGEIQNEHKNKMIEEKLNRKFWIKKAKWINLEWKHWNGVACVFREFLFWAFCGSFSVFFSLFSDWRKVETECEEKLWFLAMQFLIKIPVRQHWTI